MKRSTNMMTEKPMTEFDIIRDYFAKHYLITPARTRSDVLCGIGDDAALVRVPAQQQLAITTDTFTAGVHFLESTPAYDIGYKALAVNLSDLAAMSATPAWITLALAIPATDTAWLEKMCDGFFALADRYQVQLIGGDLTRGPLSITIQALGFVPPQSALMRSTAKPGDLIYVTGTVGDAGFALQWLQEKMQMNVASDETYFLNRLQRPEPRVAVGEQLRNIAHAAIDISDGLLADLKHILQASGVGAKVYVDQLPLSAALTRNVDLNTAINLALSAGDDYELCFTVPVEKKILLEEKLNTLDCAYTCIGVMTETQELILQYRDGRKYDEMGLEKEGYRHF